MYIHIENMVLAAELGSTLTCTLCITPCELAIAAMGR